MKDLKIRKESQGPLPIDYMKPYQFYKDSGVEWLGEIPEHWSVQRLKNISAIIPSNVDKKSKEGENPVQLCNYVDVYKNEYITDDINFMLATAASHQIKKLSLLEKDVIATKDSEDPYDIGVPALVQENMDGVVCGYHLTLLRAFQDKLDGGYLYWFVRSNRTSQYFFINARGITRYAIGSNVFKNLRIGLPPLEEQYAIANYLERKTTEVGDLISKKEQLISLLEEEKTAFINQTVTQGLHPDVPMKDSGVEWIGKIPEHWNITPLKYIVSCNKNSLKENFDAQTEIKYIEIGDVNSKSGITSFTKYKFSDAPSRARRIVKKGDVIISTVRTYLRAISPITDQYDGYIVSTGFAVLQPNQILSSFLGKVVLVDGFINEIISLSKGVSYPSITSQELINIKVPLPPSEEQNEVSEYLEKTLSGISHLQNKIEQEIYLLKEYKTALIGEVVTGKVDVREKVLVN